MRKFIILVLFLVAIAQAGFSQISELDKNVLVLPLGSFAASSSGTSTYTLRFPQDIVISGAYVNVQGAGIASAASNVVIFKLLKNAAAVVASRDTSTGYACVADTPLLMTNSATAANLKLAAGDTLTAAWVASGTSPAATGTSVIVHWYNGR